MNNSFFVGDAFMGQRTAMTQKEYMFVGAKKLDSGKWEISIMVTFVNGYAGGSNTIKWEVSQYDAIRVSGNIKGYFIIDGFNKQKKKERSIREIKFNLIETDKIDLEFVE